MQPGFDHRAALFTVRLVVLVALTALAAGLGWQYADTRAREALALAHESAVLPIPVSASTPLAPIVFSTSTPKRTIEALTPDDVVPATGKFILADLSAMQLTLYQDGTSTQILPIKTKGRPGTALLTALQLPPIPITTILKGA
jgi:hypothetical protein